MSDHRLRLMLAVSMAAFVVVILRAVQIQGVDAASLAAKAGSQQRGEVTLNGLRGSIISADGQTLAQTQPSTTISADPKQVKNVNLTAAVIAKAMGFRPFKRAGHHPGKQHDQAKKAKGAQGHSHKHKLRPNPAWGAEIQTLSAAIRRGGFVVRQLPTEVGKRIMRHHLPGLTAVSELSRWYPGNAIGSQLLGFTDIDGGAGAGKGAGLEHQYNRVLAGRPGKQVTITDPSGMVLDTVDVQKPENGRNIRLTVSAAVQTKVQDVLAATVRSTRAKWATGIVMDPRTGAIVAMATAPGYDNNQAHLAKNQARWSNQALQTVYEPGSTFKAVTFSAALSSGVVWPGEVLHNVPDHIAFGDKVIRDDIPHKPWDISVRHILKISSNIGTDEIAQMVGKHDLMHWIRRYGFGKTTALHFPGEAQGIVMPGRDWTLSSIGTIPIGQGIGVTAMQMASMYQAIANGGVMVEPHLVSRIQGEKPHRPGRRRILSPEVDAEMVSMLEGVVDGGTGVQATIPGYTVAGKTGTAQKPKNGGYSNQYDASFVGFLPAEDPQVEIMIVVDSPQTSHFGGDVAAPAFEQIGSWYANHAGIRPDRPVQ
ncbi:MAG TPA: penicillin-binding protein 2 [Gaiellales bacterium]|nr:penicillin-binding protein 2 [Gaiellales bacterium]